MWRERWPLLTLILLRALQTAAKHEQVGLLDAILQSLTPVHVENRLINKIAAEHEPLEIEFEVLPVLIRNRPLPNTVLYIHRIRAAMRCENAG